MHRWSSASHKPEFCVFCGIIADFSTDLSIMIALYILLCKNACFRTVCGYIVAYNTWFW